MNLTDALAADGDQAEVGVTDDQLARRAATDPDARAAFYLRYRDPVFRYLRARCRDEDTALDLTAATFEKALRAIGRYRPGEGGLRAWLFTIARNTATDHERRNQPLLGQWAMNTERRSEDRGPEDTAVANDERQRLLRRLRDLPEIQRDALAMRYGSGMTAREIGVVIGKTEEASQKLITRALARLKEAYHAD